MWRFSIFSFILLCLLCVPLDVSAVGISVRPTELNFSSNDEQWSAEITVTNPADYSQEFKASTQSFAESITITPERFVLPPTASQKIVVIIRNAPITGFETSLSIVGSPLADGGIAAAAGVKIPITFTVEKNPIPQKIPLWMLRLGGVITAGLAIKLLLKKIKLRLPVP